MASLGKASAGWRLACRVPLLRRQHVSRRAFSSTALRAEEARPPQEPGAKANSAESDTQTPQRDLASWLLFGPDNTNVKERVDDLFKGPEVYNLHIYSHKHNSHITLTDPNHNPVISKSSGNIGFKKAARGTYDAAHQLAANVFNQIYDGPLIAEIRSIAVFLRGYGIGREAITKALLGTEGRRIRPKVVSVADTTRIKFGGTRSKKPRRLG